MHQARYITLSLLCVCAAAAAEETNPTDLPVPTVIGLSKVRSISASDYLDSPTTRLNPASLQRHVVLTLAVKDGEHIGEAGGLVLEQCRTADGQQLVLAEGKRGRNPVGVSTPGLRERFSSSYSRRNGIRYDDLVLALPLGKKIDAIVELKGHFIARTPERVQREFPLIADKKGLVEDPVLKEMGIPLQILHKGDEHYREDDNAQSSVQFLLKGDYSLRKRILEVKLIDKDGQVIQQSMRGLSTGKGYYYYSLSAVDKLPADVGLRLLLASTKTTDQKVTFHFKDVQLP